MSDPTEQTQALGEAGERCRECAAPLAADQRYCLNCGHRRGEPRVDFQQRLPARKPGPNQNGAAPTTANAAPVTPGSPSAGEKAQRDYAPLAAVGGIAVLGVMLLIGVLIGRGDGGSEAAPPPQVVRVQGEGGGATASDEDVKPNGAAKQAKAKGSGTSAKNASGLTGDKSGGAGPVEASDEALHQLQEQSPEEYQESSAKLPDEIATGGAPPPEDGKAPGGGSKGTAIE